MPLHTEHFVFDPPLHHALLVPVPPQLVHVLVLYPLHGDVLCDSPVPGQYVLTQFVLSVPFIGSFTLLSVTSTL